MATINITINGQKVQAQTGQTVLEAATAAGIQIPTLCHHPAVTPWGGCRMCLVEIEKQRGLQPACTFPVSEGMVLSTHSERVVQARKFVLEMLFSERIHYCMFCAMSGDEQTTRCDLQWLAYQHGLTHWQYQPDTNHKWPVDASRKYFFMDHSRCILCRRCIRACDEIAANHTLGVRDRGARTMIIADADVPLGESSCISCGTCLQVCPTGALIDRRSAYMGGCGEVERARTTCMACSVGCTIDAVHRSNQLLRIEGVWDAPNGGLLCVRGRFEVTDPPPRRVTSPAKRGADGAWNEIGWDDALRTVADGLRQADGVAGLASPRATVESLGAFRHLMVDVLGSSQVGLLYGEAPIEDLGARARLPEVPAADCIVLVGADPLEDQMVVGYLVKRAVDHGASLTIVSDAETGLDPWARCRLPLAEIAQAGAAVAAADRPVILYAAGLPPAALEALRSLPEKTRFLLLASGTNAAGAARMGLRAQPVHGEALYVLAADEVRDGHELPAAGFTVVQAAYWTPAAERADVVLPARDWTEQQGSIVNIEGCTLQVNPFLTPPEGVQPDAATLDMVAQLLAA